MIDLKQAATELGQEKVILETNIQKLIDEFQNKTGFGVQEVTTTEIIHFGDKTVRQYSVKLFLG